MNSPATVKDCPQDDEQQCSSVGGGQGVLDDEGQKENYPEAHTVPAERSEAKV